MNIIELAKEAGFEVWEADYALQGQLERFAALVATHEREACAKVCDDVAKAYQIQGMLVADECAAAIRTRSEK